MKLRIDSISTPYNGQGFFNPKTKSYDLIAPIIPQSSEIRIEDFWRKMGQNSPFLEIRRILSYIHENFESAEYHPFAIEEFGNITASKPSGRPDPFPRSIANFL